MLYNVNQIDILSEIDILLTSKIYNIDIYSQSAPRHFVEAWRVAVQQAGPLQRDPGGGPAQLQHQRAALLQREHRLDSPGVPQGEGATLGRHCGETAETRAHDLYNPAQTARHIKTAWL